MRLSGRFKGYGDGWSDSAVRRYARDAGHLLGQLNELVRCDCTTRNKRRAARLLNMSRTTLIDKLNRMHIGSNGFAGSEDPALRVEEAVFRPEELTPGSDEREAVRAIA